MDIRLATPADASAIHLVFRSAFHPYKEKYNPETYSHTVVSEEVICQRMRLGKTWVVATANKIYGTVTVMETWEGFYVAGMAVLPEAQGNRWAFKLMNELEQHVRSQKAERLYLYTTTFLHGAISLYEKLGFNRYGNPTDEYLGTVLIQFEKSL